LFFTAFYGAIYFFANFRRFRFSGYGHCKLLKMMPFAEFFYAKAIVAFFSRLAM